MNKNKLNKNKVKIIKIEKEKIIKLYESINKNNSIKSLKKYLKLFSKIINEININESIRYEMDNDLVPNFVQFYVRDIAKHLKNNLKIVVKNGKFINYVAKMIYIKYIKNLIIYLEKLTENNILDVLNLIKDIELIFPFKYLSRKFIKTIIFIWSKNENVVVKIKSFLILKDILNKINLKENETLIENKNQSIEYLLKFCYLNFYNNNNKITFKNYDLMIIMCNTFSELIKEDLNIGYIIIFNILKKLTENLSKLLTIKNQENIKTLYNNQVLNTLRLITKSIIDNKNDKDFSQLIFPLIEFIKGMITLYESHKFLPLKWKLIEMLLQISESTKITLSVFNFLYNILTNKNILHLKKKKETFQKIDLTLSIKISKEFITSNQYWAKIISEVNYWIYYQWFVMNYRIYFNEYSVNIIRLIKKWLKTSKNKLLYLDLKKILLILKGKFDDNLEERLKIKKSPKEILEKNKVGSFKFKNKKIIKEFKNLKQQREDNLKSKILANK